MESTKMFGRFNNGQSLRYFPVTFMVTVIVMIVASLIFLIHEVKADTLTVDDDGDADYTNIRNAIDNASHGDTIYIYSGTYEENLVINKSLNIIGEDRENVRIRRSGSKGIFEHAISITDTNTVSISSLNITGWHEPLQGAIFIEGSRNISITGVTVYNNWVGITVTRSSSVIVKNNVFVDTKGGVGGGDVHSLHVENNSIVWKSILSNSDTGGMGFMRCEDLSLRNNTIESMHRGLNLDMCTNAVLRDNGFNDNTYSFAIDGNERTHFYHDIDISNTIDGRPIRFLMNQNNVVFDESVEYGFLGIINGSDITIQQLNLSGNGCGLFLAWVDNSHIKNVTFYGNDVGIYALYVNGTKFDNLIFIKNEYSIKFSDSSDNTISRLDVNGIFGIRAVRSHNNDIRNTLIHADQVGIYFKDSAGNRIEDNRIDVINGKSVEMISCTFTYVENNTLSTVYGIHIMISGSDNVTVTNNTILRTKPFLWLSSSEYCTIMDNSGSNDSILMNIKLEVAENNIIARHNLSGNFEYGIQLIRSKNNLIIDNLVVHNGKADIFVDRSTGNVFLNTTFDTVTCKGQFSFLVQWFLRVSVTDQYGSAMSGAMVTVTDNGNTSFWTSTDSLGQTEIMIVNEYYRDTGTIISYSPYNISAVLNGMENHTIVEINMSMLVELSIYHDILPPVVSIEPLPRFTNHTSFPVIWSGEDDHSGLANFSIFVSPDGRQWTLWIENTTLESALWCNTTHGNSIFFFALAQDRAGNKGTLPGENDSQAMTSIDVHAPQCTIGPLPHYTNSPSFEVHWSGEDNVSGIAGYTLFVSPDGENWEEWLTNTILTSAMWTNTSDGEVVYFCVTAADNAGNSRLLSEVKDRMVSTIIDISPPEQPHFSKMTNGDVSRPTIIVTFLEEVTIDLFILDGAECTNIVTTDNRTFSHTPSESLSEGPHFITLFASDIAGNSLESPATWSFTIILVPTDTTPPSIVLASSLNGTDRRPSIIIISNEPVTLVTVRLDDRNITNAFTSSPDSLTFTYIPPENLGIGEHLIRIIVMDGSGNRKEETWKFTIEGSERDRSNDDVSPFFVFAGVTIVGILVAVAIKKRRN